jgi:hypothetical protein
MKGTIIKEDNQLMIRIIDETYGKLVLIPDKESRGIIDARHIVDEVEGYIVKFIDTVPETTIKVNTWQFHIESFETD